MTSVTSKIRSPRIVHLAGIPPPYRKSSGRHSHTSPKRLYLPRINRFPTSIGDKPAAKSSTNPFPASLPASNPFCASPCPPPKIVDFLTRSGLTHTSVHICIELQRPRSERPRRHNFFCQLSFSILSSSCRVCPSVGVRFGVISSSTRSRSATSCWIPAEPPSPRTFVQDIRAKTAEPVPSAPAMLQPCGRALSPVHCVYLSSMSRRAFSAEDMGHDERTGRNAAGT